MLCWLHALCCAAVACAQLAASPWPMQGHDVARTGQSAFAGPTRTPQIKWASPGLSAGYAPPALGANGTLFVGGGDGNVYSLAADTGSTLWSYNLRVGALTTAPAIGTNGFVYTPFCALDAAAGAPMWPNCTTQTAVPTFSAPMLANGVMMASMSDFRAPVLGLLGADLLTGATKWTFAPAHCTLHAVGCAAIDVRSGTVFLDASCCCDSSGNMYGILVAFDLSSLQAAWTWSTTPWPSAVVTAPTVGPDQVVYAVSMFGEGEATLYAVQSGGAAPTVLWRFVMGNCARCCSSVALSSVHDTVVGGRLSVRVCGGPEIGRTALEPASEPTNRQLHVDAYGRCGRYRVRQRRQWHGRGRGRRRRHAPLGAADFHHEPLAGHHRGRRHTLRGIGPHLRYCVAAT